MINGEGVIRLLVSLVYWVVRRLLAVDDIAAALPLGPILVSHSMASSTPRRRLNRTLATDPQGGSPRCRALWHDGQSHRRPPPASGPTTGVGSLREAPRIFSPAASAHEPTPPRRRQLESSFFTPQAAQTPRRVATSYGVSGA